MSTEITKFRGEIALAPVEVSPILKRALDHCFDRVWPGVHGETGHFVKGRTPTAQEIEEAKRLLPQLDASLQPVSPSVLKAWLRALATALPIGGAASDPSRVSGAMNAIVQAVGDFPAMCFTDETRREIIRQCEFFPSGKRVFEILNPMDMERRAMASAVRRIADGPVYAPPPVPQTLSPDPAEKSRVGELLSDLAGDLKAALVGRAVKRDAAKAKFLDRVQLARAASEHVLALRPDLRAALEMAEQRK